MVIIFDGIQSKIHSGLSGPSLHSQQGYWWLHFVLIEILVECILQSNNSMQGGLLRCEKCFPSAALQSRE